MTEKPIPSNPEPRRPVYADDAGNAWTDSLVLAEDFEKDHKNVLRAIDALECSDDFARLNFEPCSYSKQGREFPMVRMTRDGFTFLAMGFTGPKAAQFKERYIAAFNELERRAQGQAVIPQSLPEALRLAADEAERARFARS
ncbi:MAG: Rha family transcriptional regulator, partial [Pseudomonadota bacterium]